MQDLDGSQAAQTSGINSNLGKKHAPVNGQRVICRTDSQNIFSILSNQNNALGPFDSVKIQHP